MKRRILPENQINVGYAFYDMTTSIGEITALSVVYVNSGPSVWSLAVDCPWLSCLTNWSIVIYALFIKMLGCPVKSTDIVTNRTTTGGPLFTSLAILCIYLSPLALSCFFEYSPCTNFFKGGKRDRWSPS